MANDFKSVTKQNIAIDSGAFSTMYTGLTGKETILLEVDIANTTTDDITASIKFAKSGGDTVFLVKAAPIPTGGALKAISGQKIVMEDGDILSVGASVGTSADALVSFLEDV